MRSVRFKKDTVKASRIAQRVVKTKAYNTCTLILTKPSQQAEFTTYLRNKTRGYASVLLPVIATLCLVAVGSLMMPESLTRQTLIQVIILFGFPVLIAGLIYAFSRKYIWLAEGIGPGLSTTFAICIVLLNVFSDIPDELMRVQYLSIAV